MEKESGIYVIENVINGKKYVGQSRNLRKRITSSHSGCLAILGAIRKYGKESFIQYVIEYCSCDELNFWEIYYIKEMKSHYTENGYNISFGGNASMRGRTLSENHIKKLIFSNKGRICSEKTKKAIGNAQIGEKNHNYGKSPSPSTILLMKESSIGRKSKKASSIYYNVGKKVDKYKNSEYVCWVVEIKEWGKKIRVGSFKTEIEAAKAYDKYIVENNINRPLNFPDDYPQSE